MTGETLIFRSADAPFQAHGIAVTVAPYGRERSGFAGNDGTAEADALIRTAPFGNRTLPSGR